MLRSVERVNKAPLGFDLGGVIEESLVAAEAVGNEAFVGIRQLARELLIAELHPRRGELVLVAGSFGKDFEDDAFVGLDPVNEDVGLMGWRDVLKKMIEGRLENERNFGDTSR